MRRVNLYRVTVTMEGRNPHHPDYPLLPGDIIGPYADNEEGTWIKHAPGLGIFGFVLTEKDLVDNCEVADDARWVIG